MSLDDTHQLDDVQWTATRVRSASTGATVTTVLAYLAQALSLITVPLYLQYLGKTQYGLMFLLVTLQNYLSQTNLGLNWAAMNLIGGARASGDDRELGVVFRNATLLSLLSSIVAFSVGVGIAVAWHHGLAQVLQIKGGAAVDPWAIVAVSALSGITLLGGPVYLTLIGLGKSNIAALYQGLARLLAIPAMLAVAMSGGGIARMFFVNALLLAVMLLVASVDFVRRYPSLVKGSWRPSREQCLTQLRMGIKNLSAELGFLLHVTGPTIALGVTCGPDAVPLYAIPKQLMETALVFGRSKFSILQPAYAEASQHGRTSGAARMLVDSLTRNLLLLGLLCSGFIVLCGPFIRLWTHGQLDDVNEATAIAVAGVATGLFLMQLFQLFLIAFNRQLIATRVLAVSGVLVVIASWAAGKIAGFHGVTYMAAVGSLVTAVFLGTRALQQVKLAAPLCRGLIKGGLIIAASAATACTGFVALNLLDRVAAPSVSILLTGVSQVACFALCVAIAHRVKGAASRLAASRASSGVQP